MYENRTFENILAEMLAAVTSDVDKREGSIIYDALAPAAYKLSEAYFELNNFVDLVFADTAVDGYLDRKAGDFGVARKPAVKAVRKVTASAPIPIGSRWSIESVIYSIESMISTGVYSAICESYGEIGNAYSGSLQSIENISGIEVSLTDIISSGQEEESDENLRSRLFTKLRKPATSGNAYHYEQWALEVEGVGACKVFPLGNGAGTVKLLILDSNKEIDETLETKVYDYIEQVRPIGATVTVDSPTAKLIDVSATLALDGSISLVDVQSAFQGSLEEYLKSVTFKSASVSYAVIGSMLLSTAGVQDYSNLQVNTGTANIVISDTEAPVAGTITLGV